MAHLIVDSIRRYANMRAHTATHLLHAALSTIFPQTRQAGSYVGPDELRFDFFADSLLSSEELEMIAHQINSSIASASRVSTQELPYKEALAQGAKAFFEEKYPEQVRVVTIAPPTFPGQTSHQSAFSSIELCGGTHVNSTNEIGAFVITEQTTVAAGVKRIVALTGPKVAHYANSLHADILRRAEQFGVSDKQLDAKIEKILTEFEDSQYKVKSLTQALLHSITRIPTKIENISLDALRSFEKIFSPTGLSFKEVVDQLKTDYFHNSRLLVSSSGQYALHHPQAKSFVQTQGWKGGGSADFIQGREEKILTVI